MLCVHLMGQVFSSTGRDIHEVGREMSVASGFLTRSFQPKMAEYRHLPDYVGGASIRSQRDIANVTMAIRTDNIATCSFIASAASYSTLR